MPTCNLRDHRRLLATPTGISLLRIDLALDLYAKNPFRILAKPAWLENEERDTLTQRFRNLYKLRPKTALKDTLRIGYEELVEIRDPIELLDNLRDPLRRVVWELFWPHLGTENFNRISVNGALTIPKNGVEPFLSPHQGIIEKSFGLAEIESSQINKYNANDVKNQERLLDAALWTHTLAILYHNHAFATELLITDPSSEPTRAQSYRTDADGYWRKALEYWAAITANPLFWEYLKKRIVILDDPLLPPSQLELLRDELPAAILSCNATFVRAYIGGGCLEEAVRHMRLIESNPFQLPDQQAIIVGLLRDVTNVWLNPLVRQLDDQRPSQSVPWHEVRNWLIPIIESAEKLPSELKNKFSVDEATLAEMQFDILAEKIFNGISSETVDYQPSNQKTLLFLILICRKILGLPLSASLRRRVDERRGEYTETLYGRFYSNPHQARQLDPTQCWFLPGEWADPEVSLLLPVYQITSAKDKNVLWNLQEVLIPRSRLAEKLHFEKIKEITEQRKIEVEKLTQSISELNEEYQRDRNRLEAALASAIAEEDCYRQARIRIFDEEIASEEITLKTQIQECEKFFQPRIVELETRLAAARATAIERWTPAITTARITLARLQPQSRFMRIHLPLSAVVGIHVALAMATFPMVKGWVWYYLTSLELTMRDRFHASDRMLDYFFIVVAVLVSVLLSLLCAEIVLLEKAHTTRRMLEKMEERQEKALSWVDQVLQEQRETILYEQEGQIIDQRAKLAKIAECRVSFAQEMEQIMEKVKNSYQRENERRQSFFESRLAQLKQTLEDYQSPPKIFDDKSNFPAYQEALVIGYLPGERPPKKEIKTFNKRKAIKLWPF